jgi:hypothetical protein
MVLVVPWVVHTDALLWSQRRPPKPPRRWWWALVYYWQVWPWRLLVAFARGMLLLIGGLVTQLILTVVGIVGLIPVLRGPARRLQRMLFGSVGDSYAYLFDEATWRRIEQRLADTMQRMRSRADRIIVVTHSQGTAVMHRAVSAGHIPDNVVTWVSLGSGLQKLLVLHVTRTRTLVAWAAFRLLTVGLFLASVPVLGDGDRSEDRQERHYRPHDLRADARGVGAPRTAADSSAGAVADDSRDPRPPGWRPCSAACRSLPWWLW